MSVKLLSFLDKYIRVLQFLLYKVTGVRTNKQQPPPKNMRSF